MAETSSRRSVGEPTVDGGKPASRSQMGSRERAGPMKRPTVARARCQPGLGSSAPAGAVCAGLRRSRLETLWCDTPKCSAMAGMVAPSALRARTSPRRRLALPSFHRARIVLASWRAPGRGSASSKSFHRFPLAAPARRYRIRRASRSWSRALSSRTAARSSKGASARWSTGGMAGSGTESPSTDRNGFRDVLLVMPGHTNASAVRHDEQGVIACCDGPVRR